MDKRKARLGLYRVPEKHLFTLSLIGGALGTFIGMRSVRHKTRHKRFVLGIPVCILLNALLLYPLIYYSSQDWYGILFQILSSQ